MALNPTIHGNLLLQILKDLYKDPQVGPFLGFKGGTAAYFLYNLDRFSVDLDFDLLDESKEDQVFERVKEILEQYGVVKEAQKKRFNLLYLLSYHNKIEGHQNIKVEINRRSFGSRYDVKTHLGISMKVMVQEDMAAHKLMAMVERIKKANRDIFDVWFFFKNGWPINKELVEKRAQMKYEQFLGKAIRALGKVDNRSILAGMGELLTEKQKAWVKEHLKEDTIFLLKVLLDGEKRMNKKWKPSK